MRRAGERAGAAGRRCSREPDAHTPTALALVSYPPARACRHFVASDVRTPATRALSQSGSRPPRSARLLRAHTVPAQRSGQRRTGRALARWPMSCGGRGWRAARPPSPLRGHSIDRPVRAHIDLSSGLSRLWRGKQSERRQAAEADRVGQRPNCWCCLCLCLCLCAPLPCASVGVGVRRARPVPCPARHRSRWEMESGRRAGRTAGRERGGALRTPTPTPTRAPAGHRPPPTGLPAAATAL
jgi:hypothetical protein